MAVSGPGEFCFSQRAGDLPWEGSGEFAVEINVNFRVWRIAITVGIVVLRAIPADIVAFW
jgi:hypothetical protein